MSLFFAWTTASAAGYYGIMSKLMASLLIVFVLSIVSFGTWQLFLGNLEAAFSAFPFLIAVYFFIRVARR